MPELFRHGLRKTAAAATLGCFIAGSFGAMSALDAASRQPADPVSVNRTAKGDRLPSVFIPNAGVRVPASTIIAPIPPKRPPLGCEPAFSPVVDPAYSHIYKRCIV